MLREHYGGRYKSTYNSYEEQALEEPWPPWRVVQVVHCAKPVCENELPWSHVSTDLWEHRGGDREGFLEH